MTRVLPICKVEGSFRFGPVGAVGQSPSTLGGECLAFSGRFQDYGTRLSYCVTYMSHRSQTHSQLPCGVVSRSIFFIRRENEASGTRTCPARVARTQTSVSRGSAITGEARGTSPRA